MPRLNLIDKLERGLNPASRRALNALRRAARDRDLTLYLVGGPVRDLFLDRPTLDLDLTVEGDAPAIASRAAARLSRARCVSHAAFGTATLQGPDFRIDVATARSETYARPGALPTVSPGTLRDDLYRRDFTANALALALTGPDPGALFDPFDGRADLESRLLRVLHDASFRDDATRILRGARYEARLGFRFGRATLRRLKRDVRYLGAISGARLRDELRRLLREPEPERPLRRLHALGALAVIEPALSFERPRAGTFARLRRLHGSPPVTTYLALLAWDLPPRRAAALARRLALTKRESEAVLAAPAARRLEKRLARGVKPSRVAELLSPLPLPALWALSAAGDPHSRRLALRYLERWRHVRPALNGNDLLAIGARPGPLLGKVLARLRAAGLDGDVRSRKDEESLARRLLRLPSQQASSRKASPRSPTQKASLQAGRGGDKP